MTTRRKVGRFHVLYESNGFIFEPGMCSVLLLVVLLALSVRRARIVSDVQVQMYW